MEEGAKERLLKVLRELEGAKVEWLGADLFRWLAEEVGLSPEELRRMGIRPGMPLEKALKAATEGLRR